LDVIPPNPGTLIWGAGPVFSVPSTTSLVLRTDTWTGGFAFVALSIIGFWPFIASRGDGQTGDRWTVPFAVGVSRMRFSMSLLFPRS
jgi:hypothetical protein